MSVGDNRDLDILERLQRAMHAESAAIAPRTNENIEAMRKAQAEILRLRVELEQWKDAEALATGNRPYIAQFRPG